MTSHNGNGPSKTSWGLSYGGRRRGRAFPGLLDGTVLILAWMALWTVFVLGVAGPAARFSGASAAAQVERSRT